VAASECDAARLRDADSKVPGEPSFHAAAQRFKRIIADERGLQRAADIIEHVAATGQPVLG